MATIKSYTDVAQSKTLSNILPSGSADGTWVERTHVEVKYVHSEIPFWLYGGLGIPSWSLAALLSVLPDGTDIIKDKADTENEEYICTVGVKDDIISIFGNNPVDVCYEMILKLHKLNLL